MVYLSVKNFFTRYLLLISTKLSIFRLIENIFAGAPLLEPKTRNFKGFRMSLEARSLCPNRLAEELVIDKKKKSSVEIGLKIKLSRSTWFNDPSLRLGYTIVEWRRPPLGNNINGNGRRSNTATTTTPSSWRTLEESSSSRASSRSNGYFVDSGISTIHWFSVRYTAINALIKPTMLSNDVFPIRSSRTSGFWRMNVQDKVSSAEYQEATFE
ncbi:hypothetical protein CRE_22062 [Caenorhabditis remanei]|uniref:Uncharacterized protein n=1 Tax=Caenorhabditis remanei TaxID=31234 RepID=E3N8T6_CAERE|nr:hypothetical protein CRE_22062 [Caenorhabditis remanei]